MVSYKALNTIIEVYTSFLSAHSDQVITSQLNEILL